MTILRSARLAICAALLSTLVACAERETNAPRRLIVENATVLSPGADARRASVAIVGERIVAIATDLETRSSDSVIAGDGKFLIPGLIDGHVHLAAPAGLPLPAPAALEHAAAEYFVQLPRSYLYHGFTTVVDLNIVDRTVLDRFLQAPAHPDLHHCGPGVPVENGYPMNLFPPEVRSMFTSYIVDPRRTSRSTSDTVDHSPKAAVDRAVAAGGICVKSFFEDGFGPQSDWPTPTSQMLSELRSAATAKDVVLAMHANSFVSWSVASLVPADLIVHGMWTWEGHTPGADGVLPAPIRAVLDSVLARRIGFMPTLRVIEGLAALYDSTFLDDPRLASVLPQSVLAWYRTPPARAYAEEMAEGRPPQQVRQGMLRAAELAASVTRYLVERGGRLVFGSDTPSGPTYGNPPGLNGYLELERLATARVPLDRLLAAATVDAARAFRLDSLYGTIEPGKVANLVLLVKNPLETVTAYDAIELVVSRGRPITRAALSVTNR